MWVSTADELADAAHPLFYAAAAQLPIYEQAVAAAEQEAIRLSQDESNQSGFAQVDIRCPMPKFLPAFLLYGFALENLLKGLFVRRNPEAIKSDKIGVAFSHNLVDLAREAGFNASAAEIALLQKLTTVTVWSGRYPVSKYRHEYGLTGLDREALFDDPVGAGEDIRELIQRLRGMVTSKPRDANGGGCVIIFN